MARIRRHKRHSLDERRPSPRAKFPTRFRRNLNLRSNDSRTDRSREIFYADDGSAVIHIPPHKGHSLDEGGPSLRAEFPTLFGRNLNLGSNDSRIDRSREIVYADGPISTWFADGSSGNDQFPSHIHLEPVSVESVERRYGIQSGRIGISPVAHIPPHKWHSLDEGRPSSIAEFPTLFRRNLNLRSNDSRIDRSREIVYADGAISRWFADGSSGIWSGRIGISPMTHISPPNWHSLDEGRPSPRAEFPTLCRRNLNLRSNDYRIDRSGDIVYADGAICGWFADGSSGIRSGRIGISPVAHIPPHKRHNQHSMDERRPPPRAEFPTLLRGNLNLRSNDSRIYRSGKIAYARGAITRWFAIGSSGINQFPSRIHLEPVSGESVKRRSGIKPLILVNSHLTEKDDLRIPWVVIAEKVKQDLLGSSECLRNEIDHQDSEKAKPYVVARVGKILFDRNPSVRLGSVNENQVDEITLRELKRSFYTNLPSSYVETIINRVVPKIGVDFEDEKDIYHVLLFDNRRPDSVVSCKCRVNADKKLLLYKVVLKPDRQMVADISCLEKNLDLRLMLCTKKFLTALSDDEMNSIRDLISSAVLDSDVKGGLRWPLAKQSSGNRFCVIGVWHTITKGYKSPLVKLRVRHADRFKFKTGIGEATREVHLKLIRLVSELQEHGAESEEVSTVLRDSLSLIWNYFLCCGRFLT